MTAHGSETPKSQTPWIPGAVMLAALAAHWAVVLPFVHDGGARGGGDYGYFLPHLLAGYFFFAQNGPFAVPWFTPAFCGGMPYFANMQAMYYSVPQMLTIAAGPTLAIQLTVVLFSAAGLFGFYALMRRSFAATPWGAASGAILFLFNGFFTFRMIAGHLTFHAFMLAPLIALLVIGANRSGEGEGARPVPGGPIGLSVPGAGLVIAYMVYSGMAHALLPTLGAVVAMILIRALIDDGAGWGRALARLAAACVIGAALAASKLAAAVTFLAAYPRDMLPLMGFDSIGHSATVAFRSLFIFPPFVEGLSWIANNAWYKGENVVPAFHEYGYGVGLVPLLLMAAALPWGLARVRRAAGERAFARKAGLGLAVLVLLILPVLLNWYAPGWTAFLKGLPVIASSTTLIRWFCLYIPVVALVAALIVDRFHVIAPRLRPAIALASLALGAGWTLLAGNIYTGSKTFRDDAYAFTTIERAYDRTRASGEIPAIARIDFAGLGGSPWERRRDRNDSMVHGASQAHCYEPMFGHRLEAFPFTVLRPGPVFPGSGGRLNIKNPACMLFPEENRCRPGDQFRTTDAVRARRFASYHTFAFARPAYQRIADALSLAALIGVLGALALAGAGEWRRRAGGLVDSPPRPVRP